MDKGSLINPWRITAWGLAGSLLLLPAIAMRLTDEVNWTGFDFAVFAAMLGLAGISLELLLRARSGWAYRLGAIAAVISGFMIVWANGAVGMIGNENNPYNLWFGLVLAIAILGALARARPQGLAVTFAIAGATQLIIAALGASQDPRGALFSSILASGWLVAALLMKVADGRVGALA